MFGWTILDVAIGLAFAYLLLSLMCTAVNEWIAGILGTRGKTLQEGLRHMLSGQALPGKGTFVDAFYSHPLIRSIRRGGERHPSYISGRSFALAVMDVCAPHGSGPLAFGELVKGIQDLPEGEVRRTLLTLLRNTDQQLETAQQRIEDWFNDSMDRVSGWFKRQTQTVTVVVAVVVTLLANADTLQMGNRLWSDPTLRAETVERARVRAEGPRPLVTAEYTDTNPKPSKPSVVVPPQAAGEGSPLSSEVRAQIGDLVGWSGDFRRFNQFSVERELGVDPAECANDAGAGPACFTAIRKVRAKGDEIHRGDLLSLALLWWLWWLVSEHLVGWSLTVVAISLGAPFWFDALKGLVNLRSAGKPAQPDRPARQKAEAKTSGK